MWKSLILAAMLAGAAASAAPAGVSLTATLPPVIYMTPSGPSVATVIVAVANTTGAPVRLTVPNSCGISLWNVTDSQGNDIEGRTICPMIYQPQSWSVPAAGRHDNVTIVFDGAKYRAGEIYTFHYRYWGLAADTIFKIARP